MYFHCAISYFVLSKDGHLCRGARHDCFRGGPGASGGTSSNLGTCSGAWAGDMTTGRAGEHKTLLRSMELPWQKVLFEKGPYGQ